MSPVASSTDEHSVARLSSSNAAVGTSKKSPSGRLTSPAAYVFAPSWMSNSKESNKSSNLAFSSFSATGSPTAMSPQQRVIQGKYRDPAPRSSNSSPYPGYPSHKLSSNKSAHHVNATTDTATNTSTLPALHSITTTSTIKKSTSVHRSRPSNASSTSSSLQDSEFPTLVEETTSDKRHDGGRSAWGNPNAIKSKVFCPPTTETDETNEEMAMSPYDIELERLKALVPKRNSGSSISTSSTTVTSKRNSHHNHHHHHYHHHNNNSNNNNSQNSTNNNNNNNNNTSNNNSHHYHHHHHPSSPLVSPTPSRSLSSSQRMRFNNNNKSSRTTYNSNSGHNHHNNNGNTGNNMNNSNMRTSPLTKVPLQIPSRETSVATSAVVKLPTTTAAAATGGSSSSSSSSITSSRPKRTSSSGSSISSFISQPTSVCDQRLEPPPYRICELNDDTMTTSSSSFLESPRTLIEEDMMEEVIIEEDEVEEKEKDIIEVYCVNDHEREHFLSWVRTWACRPAVKANSTTMKAINPRFFGNCGEYSYFGPLGTNTTTISK